MKGERKDCTCTKPLPMKTVKGKTPRMYCKRCGGWLASEWYDRLLASMGRIEEQTQRGEFKQLPDERIYTPTTGLAPGEIPG